MERKRKIGRIGLISLAVAVMIAVLAMPAIAYTIDGCPGDWGINLSEDWSQKETWIPLSATAFGAVEDNKDCSLYYSGENHCGVHIIINGEEYTDYKEPPIVMLENGKLPASYSQPYAWRTWSARASELNDIEGMYCDEDETHVFVNIITSVPPKVMSDLAIDADGDPSTGNYGCEYGIVLTGEDQGKVYLNPEWQGTEKFKGRPYRITGGTIVGMADVAYKDTGISDFGRTNWVIELSVQKPAFEEFSSSAKLHITLRCGNEFVIIPELPAPTPIPTITPNPTPMPSPSPAPTPTSTSIPTPSPTITPTPIPEDEIPEFTTIAIPAILVLLLFFFNYRKRRRN